MSIYTDKGYENRTHYLEDLAVEHGLPIEAVQFTADMNGPTEDFDGLLIALEDFRTQLIEIYGEE